MLRSELIKNWDGYCKIGTTDAAEIPLNGPLLDCLNKFDFTIFKYKTVVELVAGHAKTIYHTRRFGTASVPERPPVVSPPGISSCFDSMPG